MSHVAAAEHPADRKGRRGDCGDRQRELALTAALHAVVAAFNTHACVSVSS